MITKEQALMSVRVLDAGCSNNTERDIVNDATATILQFIEQQSASTSDTALQNNEQYRMQMAGISTAASGYWREGESVHPDYDTPALRDVAKLYAKYDELFKAASTSAQVPDGWQLVPITVTPEIEAVYANDSGAYQTAQELHDAMLQAAMLNQPQEG